MQIDIRSYLPYLLRLRIVPLILLAAASLTRLRKAAAMLFLVWTGFTGGVAVSSAADGLGLKGSLLCAVSLLPQFLFYIPAFVILLWYCLSAPRTQWNRQKTMFVLAAVAAGILLELYINPGLVRAFYQSVSGEGVILLFRRTRKADARTVVHSCAPSSAHRYPWIPNFGTARKTPAMRMRRPDILMRKLVRSCRTR